MPFKPVIVPPSEPSPKEELVRRIKKVPKPDGQWMCNRCGSISAVTETAGIVTRKGRKQGGTVIVQDVCATCWKQGINVPMRPELKPVK